MFKISPTISHSLLSLLFQNLIGIPIWLWSDLSLVVALIIGGAFSIGFYVGRERAQAEFLARSKKIAPWNWSSNPRALRDIGYPVVTVTAACLLIWWIGL